MLEILCKLDRLVQREREKFDNANAERLTESRVQSVWHDAPYLVRSGANNTISELTNELKRKYEVKRLGCTRVQVSARADAVCKHLDIEAL